MKKQILIALLFSVTPLLFSHSTEVSPPADGTGFIKTEWIEKIYQANRRIETAEIEYCVFDEDKTQSSRMGIVWDDKNKRVVKTSTKPAKDPNLQEVSKFFIIGTKGTSLEYQEEKNAGFVPSQNIPKKSRAFIRKIVDWHRLVRMFFLFDDDGQGNHYCELMRKAPPEILRQIMSEVELRGEKCLKLSGPDFIIFEKERGIVLEKTLYRDSENDKLILSEKIEYFDHQFIDGIWFPMTVHCAFYSPDSQEKPVRKIYKINPGNLRLNHKIPEWKFSPDIPKGAEVYDDIEGLNYISTGFTRERENSIKKQLDEIFEESEK